MSKIRRDILCTKLFLIFDELLKIPEMDVFLSVLSRGTGYKWLQFDRKKCFDKTLFWPFVGIGVFRWPSQSNQQLVSCQMKQILKITKIQIFRFFFQRFGLNETCFNICPSKNQMPSKCYLKLVNNKILRKLYFHKDIKI